MKKLLMVFALVAGFHHVGTGQEGDSLRVFADVFVSGAPMFLAGVEDVSNSPLNGNGQPISPDYQYREVKALALRMGAHVNFHIPLYKSENWSTGFRFLVGAGAQMGVVNGQELTGVILDLPQYVFYRNTASNLDYTLMLGYKWSFFTQPYHNFVAAAEVRLTKHIGLRLNGTLNSYLNYGSDQAGNLTVIARISEYGIGVLFYH